MRLNLRFVVRAFITFLAVLAFALTLLSFLPSPILRQWVLWAQAFNSPPLEATPLPPLITAPRGEMPGEPIGLTEWAQFDGGAFEPRGSGFLLRLGSGEVVGVTTTHSVGDLRDAGDTLRQLALGLPGQSTSTFIVQIDTLYGEPGVPRTSDDLTVDWLLLKVNPSQTIDPSLILTPDSRGAPQPGERVSLFGGWGKVGVFEGTVQSVDTNGIWVLMDETFDAGGMSGSPLISQHTGQVVGMAIAVDYGRNRVRVGFNPIGVLVQKAEAATQFPKINQYTR